MKKIIFLFKIFITSLFFFSLAVAENIDFFKNDPPESVAQKLMCANLSDLSAMGSYPYCYMMNLCIPKYINISWVKIFTNHVFAFAR